MGSTKCRLAWPRQSRLARQLQVSGEHVAVSGGGYSLHHTGSLSEIAREVRTCSRRKFLLQVDAYAQISVPYGLVGSGWRSLAPVT